MSSDCCPDCGASVDLDNESHAGFCPLCGSDSSESFDDYCGEFTDLGELSQTQREQAAVETARQATLQSLLTRYRKDRSGIRYEPLLRDVCLECSSSDVYTERGRHECLRPKCRAKWYASHCWKCDDGGVDSRDVSSPKCARCGWRSCSGCGACSKNCPQGGYSR